MKTPLFVRKIAQKDHQTFFIEWNDGVYQEFHLSDLQRRCPCAHCVDARSLDCLWDSKSVSDDVRAIAIRSVGRYALRIQFTSGCSKGIYRFDMLYKVPPTTPP